MPACSRFEGKRNPSSYVTLHSRDWRGNELADIEREKPQGSPRPINPEPARVRDASATKRRILDAAEILFSWKGLSGVTLREIAQLAEVNVPLLCHHFRDKDTLYQAALERILERLVRIWQESFTGPGTAPEQLQSLIIGLCDVVETESRGMAFLHRELLDGGSRASALIERWVLPLKDLALRGLACGQERGELRSDLDSEMLLLHILSAAFYPAYGLPVIQAVFGARVGTGDWHAQRKAQLLKLVTVALPHKAHPAEHLDKG